MPRAVPSSAASGLAASQASIRVSELRRRIDALEQAGTEPVVGQHAGLLGALSFGVPEIDDALPWRIGLCRQFKQFCFEEDLLDEAVHAFASDS